MTLSDLSKVTGYSTSTISKAFSNSDEIPVETKNLIFETAKKFGVYEKYIKKEYDKKVIALIVPEIKSEYYTNIIDNLIKIIDKHNAISVVSVTNFNEKLQDELVLYYSTNQNSDGIIILGGFNSIKKYDLPIIRIGTTEKEDYINAVKVDLKSGLLQALANLKQLNHKKIAFIGERKTKGKEKLFIECMKELNLDVDYSLIVENNERFEQSGFLGMETLFDSNNLPTAIIGAYDYICLGIVKSIEKHNLKVPEDFSLIGFDDISISSNDKFSLSSIGENIDDYCNIAVDILFKRINNSHYNSSQTPIVKTNYIKRSSVQKNNKE